jgi:hypothetical protein
MKNLIFILSLCSSFVFLTSCDSSSTISSDTQNDSDNSLEYSSTKEIVSWTDWDEDSTEFDATSTYGDASGFATFDGGDFTPTQADTIRAEDTGTNSYIRQSYNESYYIDFEITVDETYTELTEFSFDTYFSHGDGPQKYWALSVEPNDHTSENTATEGFFPESEITVGTVGRAEITTGTKEWQTISFDLTELADHDAGANGTVLFRLYNWGGTENSESSRRTVVDNVSIRATQPSEVEAEAPGLGERADWLRSAWGVMWKPDNLYNGYVEDVTIEDYIAQIEDLKTIDYTMVLLTGASTYSPVHTAPNDILESLWGDDAVADEDFTEGDTINLIVPRASSGADPLKSWLEDIRAAGMKTMVYVHSAQMLNDNDTEYPDVDDRWKTYCDESEAAQAFLDSKPYYRDDDYENREYMFCYAEFILRDYAKTYGDLIDAWIFDLASVINSKGDDQSTGVLDDQRIYQAFAEAIRAGNPNVPASFNNSPGDSDESGSPITDPTLFDDYAFGHPFAGGDYIGGVPDTDAYGPGDDDYDSSSRYDLNYRIIEFMYATDGNVFDLDEALDYFNMSYTDSFSWDDQVVGHYFPPMATLSWNSGSTAALTDEHFTLWNTTAMTGGGAISWGGPLSGKKANQDNFTPTLTAWALSQLTVMDESLAENENPDEPNWYRADTVLTTATVGEAYSHTLTEEVDFWYPGGDVGSITDLSFVDGNEVPSWLSIELSETVPATFVFSGTPTEVGEYEFDLQLTAYDASTSVRTVTLTIEAAVTTEEQ